MWASGTETKISRVHIQVCDNANGMIDFVNQLHKETIHQARKSSRRPVGTGVKQLKARQERRVTARASKKAEAIIKQIASQKLQAEKSRMYAGIETEGHV